MANFLLKEAFSNGSTTQIRIVDSENRKPTVKNYTRLIEIARTDFKENFTEKLIDEIEVWKYVGKRRKSFIGIEFNLRLLKPEQIPESYRKFATVREFSNLDDKP